MTEETATNPVADDTSRVDSAAGVATEASAPADDIDTEAFDRMEAPEDDDAIPEDGDGDGEPSDKPASGEDDSIEVEVGGQKLRVPKAVEPLLLMQSDYTRKTQALAEESRKVTEQAATLEAQRAQQAESLKAFRDEHMTIAQGEAALRQLDTQLADYRKLTPQDWATLRSQDPANYQHHSDNYEFLRRTRTSTEDALDAARKDLTTKETKLSESQQAARTAQLAKAWEETHGALQREVKDWTPQRFQATAKFAVDQLGYKPEELREATDPRAWKMATMIMDRDAEIAKLKTQVKQQTTAQNNAKAQTVTPAAERPRGSSQPRGVTDTLSTEEWVRRREAQVARRAKA